MSKHPHFWLIFSIWCVAYADSIWQYVETVLQRVPQPAWASQLLAVIILGVVASVSLPFVPRRSGIALIVFQILGAFVLTVPDAIPGASLVPVFLSIIVQINVLLEPIQGLAASLVFSIGALLSKFPDLSNTISLSSTMQLFFLLPIVVTLLSFIVRKSFFLLDRVSGEVKALSEGIDRVVSANVSFQQYAEQVKRESAEEERRQITRDIHDTIGYTLTNVIMMLEDASINFRGNSAALEGVVRDACEIARNGLTDIRHELRILRGIQAPPEVGLGAIRSMVDNFQRVTGVDISFDYANFPESVGQVLDLFIYHFIQEGLVNAVRHGKTSRVTIYFWRGEKEIVVTLQDNGGGSVDQKKGIGLIGLHERIAIVGGELSYGNFADGFQLTARLPATLSTN